MSIHLDSWVTAPSTPINVPMVRKGSTVVIGTPSHTYPVYVNNVSSDLLIGTVIITPPEGKHFRKADMVMFHAENVIDFFEVDQKKNKKRS